MMSALRASFTPLSDGVWSRSIDTSLMKITESELFMRASSSSGGGGPAGGGGTPLLFEYEYRGLCLGSGRHRPRATTPCPSD